MTSLPVGQEGHCVVVDWIDMLMTRVYLQGGIVPCTPPPPPPLPLTPPLFVLRIAPLPLSLE